MKIMQVIPAFGTGGGEIMCETLTTKLTELGHEVMAVSLYKEETAITERLQKKGIKVLFVGKKPGFDLSCILELRKIIRSFKPDIIHTHLYALKYAVFAKLFFKTKEVHTIHNIAEKEASTTDQKLNRLFYRLKLAIPVSLSQEIQKTVVALYRISPQNCPVVLNGIDLSKCLPKVDYGLHSPIKIIHVGRFSEQKNHVYIIEALKQLPRNTFCLDFWGDGELLGSIKNLAKQYRLEGEINFNGTTDNILKELANADIFILPSKWEGVPMSIIEAMGTGLPIVASAVGGIPDMLINEESALLLNAVGDPSELANALFRLSISKELREKLGTQAHTDAELFSSDSMARRYVNIYQGNWRSNQS